MQKNSNRLTWIPLESIKVQDNCVIKILKRWNNKANFSNKQWKNCNLLTRLVELIIAHNDLYNRLASYRRHAIIWTNDDPIHWQLGLYKPQTQNKASGLAVMLSSPNSPALAHPLTHALSHLTMGISLTSHARPDWMIMVSSLLIEVM